MKKKDLHTMPNEQFYDIVDSIGQVLETAEEQLAEAGENVETVVQDSIPLQREQPNLSEGEKKKLRKQYVTIQHPIVKACGHTLDLSRQPRHNNCQHCVFAFFQNHGELVQQLDEMHTSGKDALIIQLQGKKFYRNWRRFMSTIANLKQEEISDNTPS
jgi:hypothetical protein